MTALVVFAEDGAGAAAMLTAVPEIRDRLAAIGVLFEQWCADQPLRADADQAEVLAAYAEPIQRLDARFHFQSMDVVGLRPDHAKRDEMRQKFLREHTHADFEVRFFVRGCGIFYLHAGGEVLAMVCTAGDLISVPALTTHWFDMGRAPDFQCIRFFTTPDGWVGDFTGDEIARRIPDFDALVETLP